MDARFSISRSRPKLRIEEVRTSAARGRSNLLSAGSTTHWRKQMQQARLTDRPIEQVLAGIQRLDRESVKSRSTDPKLGEGWTREHADSIEVAYKNYLTMLVKYQDDAEDILLAEDVDEFWHTHILQTIKYTDDCEAVFGKYLHHTPHIGEVTTADLEKRTALAEKTRRLYEREFGNE